MCPFSITMTKSLVNHITYKTTNHWHCVDEHCNVLSIQHVLLAICVFIMVWVYRFSSRLFETRPCGQAERRNYLALFTLTQLKMKNHAKGFIALAIHLFINRYSQATSYRSPLIYLYLLLSVKLDKAGERLTHSVLLFLPSLISPRSNCIECH